MVIQKSSSPSRRRTVAELDQKFCEINISFNLKIEFYQFQIPKFMFFCLFSQSLV